MKTRIEHDTFGPIEVPAERLWGAQTQRSLQHFNISGERMPRELIRALAQVKRACAVVNHLWACWTRTRRGHRRRGRRGARRQARRRVPAGGLADRLGHADQHERQRGARQPRQRAAGRRARRGAPGAPERRRQQGPVVQRRLPHRDARGRGGGASRNQLLPALAQLRDTLAAKARGLRRTSSRSAAPTCRTRRRSRWARSSPATSRSSTTATAHLRGGAAAPVRAGARRHRGRHRASTRPRATPSRWRRRLARLTGPAVRHRAQQVRGAGRRTTRWCTRTAR